MVGRACCQIGRRGAGTEGETLGGAICLPLLIDRDLDVEATGDGFMSFRAGQLRASIGAPRVSTALTESLLRSGNVMVIVDGLSERDRRNATGTQQQCLLAPAPPMASAHAPQRAHQAPPWLLLIGSVLFLAAYDAGLIRSQALAACMLKRN
jgi:hypothetical protein